MVFVHVNRTGKLCFLAHSLTENHDLLKEEARERLDLGRCVGLARRRKVVKSVQRPFV